jgi:hypothetical protein
MFSMVQNLVVLSRLASPYLSADAAISLIKLVTAPLMMFDAIYLHD